MKNTNHPKVTIFTCVYNTGHFVVEALKEIKKIDYPNIEHILVDDFSTDGVSVDLVENWIRENNYKCVFIKHEKNWGLCKTLNQIIKSATGKFIIGCSDDILEVDSINNMVNHFLSLPSEYKIVFGDISYIDEKGFILIKSHFNHNKINPKSEIIDFSSYLRKTKRFPTFGVMYKVEALKQVGLYDESLRAEDVDMHLRLLNKYKCSYCGYKVGCYRRHSAQMSQDSHTGSDHDRIKIYLKWINKVNGIDRKYIIKSLEKIALRGFYKEDTNSIKTLKSVISIKILVLNMLLVLKISPKTLDYFFKLKNSFH